jgi:hypothetical protein
LPLAAFQLIKHVLLSKKAEYLADRHFCLNRRRLTMMITCSTRQRAIFSGLKEATVKRFHYENNNELSSHPTSFVAAYDFAKRLQTLNGPTPYEFICKARTNQPERFGLNQLHEIPGLNTLSLLKKRLSYR